MTTIIESIPTVWDEQRDRRFFGLTSALFAPSFCYGASVLLASYDPDEHATAGRAADGAGAATAPVCAPSLTNVIDVGALGPDAPEFSG